MGMGEVMVREVAERCGGIRNAVTGVPGQVINYKKSIG